MILIKEFEFDSAHFLPSYNGKCEVLHGHTYKMVIKLEGYPDSEGMIIDFIELKHIVKKEIVDLLDHTCLNDIFEQPSAENIAIWVWNKLDGLLKRENCALYEVEIWETKTSGVVYRGEKLLG